LARQRLKVTHVNVEETPDWFSRLLTASAGVVVLDSGLAAQQGWEILKVLKGNPATESIPVLFYAQATTGEAASLLELDYLTKPISQARLTQVLARQGALAETSGETRTILIVDDQPGILEMYARMVHSQSPQYQVLRARNGYEALELMQHTRPDLILLDLMMPELDGFGVLEAMQQSESTRTIPVIILTAQRLNEHDMARLNRGVATILEKGLFSVEETLAHVSTALARNFKLGSEARRLVRKAMAYVHTHYAEPITREALATYVGVSESYLTRCFHQETGMALLTYLNRYRIKRAKDLLEGGERTITQVALAVGFASETYFMRVFRREAGVSPGAYRRQQRKKQTDKKS
jgi:AraC-like DNA-binding protein/DNA-binding LytR/AlgR family response regulator